MGAVKLTMSAARSASASRGPSVGSSAAPHHGFYGAPSMVRTDPSMGRAPHYPYSMTPYEHAPPPYAAAPHHPGYAYGDTSVTHHSRVADAEHTALSSDVRLADQEHRRMSDLALRDNFERRISELEAPIRDL